MSTRATSSSVWLQGWTEDGHYVLIPEDPYGEPERAVYVDGEEVQITGRVERYRDGGSTFIPTAAGRIFKPTPLSPQSHPTFDGKRLRPHPPRRSGWDREASYRRLEQMERRWTISVKRYGGWFPWSAFITHGIGRLGEPGSTTYSSRTPHACVRKAMRTIGKIVAAQGLPEAHITIDVERTYGDAERSR